MFSSKGRTWLSACRSQWFPSLQHLDPALGILWKTGRSVMTISVSPRSTGIVWAELIKAGSSGRVRRSPELPEGLAQTDAWSKSSRLCYSPAGRRYNGKQVSAVPRPTGGSRVGWHAIEPLLLSLVPLPCIAMGIALSLLLPSAFWLVLWGGLVSPLPNSELFHL